MGKGLLTINGVGYPIYKIHYYLGLIPAIYLEKPWTILTAMFVHSDLWHILFNMIALFFFGRTLTMLVGSGRFLMVYFIGGIVGNLLFYLVNSSSFSPLVGASGAVYAIAGTLVIMVPNMRVALWGIIPMPLWVFVIVFLLLLSLPPFVAVNVAWQAHLGGLVVGLVAGYFFRKKLRYIVYR
jgi:membrane associated rhomboid family serine protease